MLALRVRVAAAEILVEKQQLEISTLRQEAMETRNNFFPNITPLVHVHRHKKLPSPDAYWVVPNNVVALCRKLILIEQSKLQS
ncbi:hypothetical protein ACE6H2_026906 [Prunus campanulata]